MADRAVGRALVAVEIWRGEGAGGTNFLLAQSDPCPDSRPIISDAPHKRTLSCSLPTKVYSEVPARAMLFGMVAPNISQVVSVRSVRDRWGLSFPCYSSRASGIGRRRDATSREASPVRTGIGAKPRPGWITSGPLPLFRDRRRFRRHGWRRAAADRKRGVSAGRGTLPLDRPLRPEGSRQVTFTCRLALTSRVGKCATAWSPRRLRRTSIPGPPPAILPGRSRPLRSTDRTRTG